MKTVFIELATRSIADLQRAGVYRYAENRETDVLLLAYAFGEEGAVTWCPGDTLDERLIDHIESGGELHAWDAQLHRILWRDVMARHGWPVPPIESWYCTMARAVSYGLPRDFSHAAKALGAVPPEHLEAKRLLPVLHRPVRFDGGEPVWFADSYQLRTVAEYYRENVRVQRKMADRLQPLSDHERSVYLLDQRINDRGVHIDVELAEAAKDCAEDATERANCRIRELTSGAVRSVSAVADLTRWLNSQGLRCEGVAKADIREMQRNADASPVVREVLQIRSETAKSSVAKLDSMLAYAQADCRMRGLLVYHGAATGRWAGRGPQPQNLPRGEIRGAEAYIPFVMERNVEALNLCDAPLAVVSSLLRSVIVAGPGNRLIAGDYSAIEARVLAWLAGHQHLLEMFRRGEDPYKTLAASIYGVPAAAVTNDQRVVGKQALLGLGYEMGAPRFASSCANNGVQINDGFAYEVVRRYRVLNPPITDFWKSLNAAAIKAMATPGVQFGAKACDLRFQYRDGWLYMRLPSGRTLKYEQPILDERSTPFGETYECVTFRDLDTRTQQPRRSVLYGGLLAENVTQAVARDLLADAMLLLESRGYLIVLTIHDEIVCEVPEKSHHTVQEFRDLMATVPPWATGCPLKVEAWQGDRYRK